jgi:hypothetical protein
MFFRDPVIPLIQDLQWMSETADHMNLRDTIFFSYMPCSIATVPELICPSTFYAMVPNLASLLLVFEASIR